MARLLDKHSVPTAGPRRDLRAVELLELIGSAEARRVLQTVAGGMPGARLTREARSALQRLAQQAATHCSRPAACLFAKKASCPLFLLP